MSFAHKVVCAGGFETHYLEGGETEKPWLVLVHDGGFGTTAELCWGEVIDLLSDAYRIVAPDLLGFGHTDKAVFLDRSPYEARIPHVASFLREVGAADVTAMGVSFGGSLVIRAMLAPGNPWDMRKGISVSGTGGPFRLESGIKALSEFTPSLEDSRRLTELLVTSVDGLDEHVRQRHENSLIPGHWEAMMAPRLHNPSLERRSSQDDLLHQLTGLRMPLLLIEGERDQLLEKGWSRKLAEQSGMITAVTMRYGHEPNIDHPDGLVDQVKDFLAASRL